MRAPWPRTSTASADDGDIAEAVREVRAQGIVAEPPNVAGRVPDAADFVVTDPVQARVMTVMAVARTPRSTSATSAAVAPEIRQAGRR